MYTLIIDLFTGDLVAVVLIGKMAYNAVERTHFDMDNGNNNKDVKKWERLIVDSARKYEIFYMQFTYFS